MNTAQRMVKWLAIAFAVFLTCGILMAITAGGMAMSYMFGLWTQDGAPETGEMVEIDGDVAVETIEKLEIDVKLASLTVKRGEKFQVLANDGTEIETRRDGSRLVIEEREFRVFQNWGRKRGEIVIVLPEEMNELTEFALDAGAGSIKVEDVTARKVRVNLGAGRTELVRLVALETTKLNGGAGYLAVRESELKNLDFEMGVGKAEITAKLTGVSEIDAGVGKLDLNLVGPSADYRIKIDSVGLGAITLDGEKVDEGYYGDGGSLVKIDGGVGAIEVHRR